MNNLRKQLNNFVFFFLATIILITQPEALIEFVFSCRFSSKPFKAVKGFSIKSCQNLSLCREKTSKFFLQDFQQNKKKAQQNFLPQESLKLPLENWVEIFLMWKQATFCWKRGKSVQGNSVIYLVVKGIQGKR